MDTDKVNPNNLETFSVSELKKLLIGKGIDPSTCLEKNDLIKLYRNNCTADLRNRRPNPTSSQPKMSQAASTAARRRQRPSVQSSPSTENKGNGNYLTYAVVAVFIAYMFINNYYFGPGEGEAYGEEDIDYDDTDQPYLAGRVIEVTTHTSFKGLLQYHRDCTGLPVIVDFYSQRCGPCRMIAPVYKRMAKEFKGRAVFLKVDVNRNYETSSASMVRSMPTFHFYLNNKKRNAFSGASSHRLRSVTESLVASAEKKGTFAGVEVTEEILQKFYKRHDKSKISEAGTLATKYQKKTAKLIRMLKKKYGDAPQPVAIQSKTSKKSEEKSSSKPYVIIHPKMEEKKYTSIDLSSASVYDLKRELERRAEAENIEAAKALEEGDEELFITNTDSEHPVVEKVVIIGGGPAGLAAGIYAARAGLKPLIIAPDFGGQLLGKGVEVENYPGVIGEFATGRGLVSLMRRQAHSFESRLLNDVAISANLLQRPFSLKLNGTHDENGKQSTIHTHALIIASGADTRWLDIDGETQYRGLGVSSCATCDGFLFREKPVLVIGGGDTAMEDALVLSRTSKTVTIIHRRSKFRASRILQKRVLDHPKISILWNTVALEFVGTGHGTDNEHLTGVIVQNLVTKKKKNSYN